MEMGWYRMTIVGGKIMERLKQITFLKMLHITLRVHMGLANKILIKLCKYILMKYVNTFI